MKLIIAGSRHFSLNTEFINGIIRIHNLDLIVDTYVSGTANGVDSIGEEYALEMQGLCGEHAISIKRFPADWDTHGKKAGHLRNAEMAEYADALLLIWDGESKGSANMKKQMQKLQKPIYEVILKKDG